MSIPAPILIGGALGAMTSDDPLKGAMMGGLLGFGGSKLFGLGQAADPMMAGAMGPGVQASGAITSAATPTLTNSAFTPLGSSVALSGSQAAKLGLDILGGISPAEALQYQASLAPEGIASLQPQSFGEKMLDAFDGLKDNKYLNAAKMIDSQNKGEEKPSWMEQQLLPPPAPPQLSMGEPRSFSSAATTYPYGTKQGQPLYSQFVNTGYK